MSCSRDAATIFNNEEEEFFRLSIYPEGRENTIE